MSAKGILAQAARKLKAAEVSAKIFGNAFNPTGARTGNYILRQGFRGEHMVRYYPSKQDLNNTRVSKLSHQLGEKLYDPDEIDRLNVLERRKARGKGAPKKGQGKRALLAKKKKR
ncbi:mitochondral 37S ribosomal protein S27 [Coemansia sp. RSA 1813]|nr:mitochondral 37S ribosomal protein S27 [Coemansia sp. RSA 1646]KAJ1772430.1 mitochondral 37S ribosomal protein S27 [Coemansia sp. RSA 1843]KAJ2091149.1 mitochondral 37S ribosomal protein S27 [Coemansia sp. RSA 986]KAJ2213596.1 mitochondral 37S ribosomal protein S27 [Coemansia sp. RSA 487]KAJ2571127.1 mitochondral 37S ribosomal protein S27 [Coemansia sp. RSA 1813]